MNNNDYKEALFYAASIFNERLGTEFGVDNLVLRCFQTENQQEVFEQFCKQYFPDRLTDQYKEDGYFDFHASAFVGKEDGVDGILLRTDIARHPAELKHILLHGADVREVNSIVTAIAAGQAYCNAPPLISQGQKRKMFLTAKKFFKIIF